MLSMLPFGGLQRGGEKTIFAVIRVEVRWTEEGAGVRFSKGSTYGVWERVGI